MGLSLQITSAPVSAAQPTHPLQKVLESWAVPPVYIFQDCTWSSLHPGRPTHPASILAARDVTLPLP